jgi:hypothetical protein
MGDIESRIIMLIENAPGLTDRDLAEAIRGHGASPQYINQNCRNLESRNIIARKKREDGLIGNWLNISAESSQFADWTGIKKNIAGINEKRIKQLLEAYLIALGWEPKIAWGLTHGIDIEARNGLKRWVIEVKGIENINTLLSLSFVSILGEVLQRMDDPQCKYSIALPDIDQFRRLWYRLPGLVKERLGITVLFVDQVGKVTESAV